MSGRRTGSGRPGLGLAGRLLTNIGLVILAGAVTVLVAAVLLAPALFQLHLHNAGVVVDQQVLEHVNRAFEQAVLTALAVGTVAAALTALALSWLIARRIAGPIRDAADAASDLADGRLQTRLADPRMGPELATLTTAINELARRLEVTESTRRELTAELAHQLRTPIASLEATVEAVREQVLPVDATTLETLSVQSARLRRLVADLEVVSRAHERQLLLSAQPVPVADLVTAAVTASRDRYRAAAVELVGSVEPGTPDVVVDADRIGEVLAGLLENSLRHAPAGGRVEVKAGPGPDRRDPTAVIRVQDSGAGFPSEDAEELFRRFHKGPGSTGSGLGLTIARAIVEAHHGTIVAASEGPGTGATVTVTIPASSRTH